MTDIVDEVVGKIIHLRDNYHFGPASISMYLKRFDISRRNAETSVRFCTVTGNLSLVFAAPEHAAGTLITLRDT